MLKGISIFLKVCLYQQVTLNKAWKDSKQLLHTFKLFFMYLFEVYENCWTLCL